MTHWLPLHWVTGRWKPWKSPKRCFQRRTVRWVPLKMAAEDFWLPNLEHLNRNVQPNSVGWWVPYWMTIHDAESMIEWYVHHTTSCTSSMTWTMPGAELQSGERSSRGGPTILTIFHPLSRIQSITIRSPMAGRCQLASLPSAREPSVASWAAGHGDSVRGEAWQSGWLRGTTSDGLEFHGWVDGYISFFWKYNMI